MSCNYVIKQRVAIFQKGEHFGIVAMAISPSINLVSRNDPRLEIPVSYKAFATPAEAKNWFEEYVIATVSENAWSIAFNGTPNNARLS